MYTQFKSKTVRCSTVLTAFLLSYFLFPVNTGAQVDITANYTFETIEVPGVDFLAVTASSDFEDYAGYTKSADGEKEVAFTLIDGVFETYDFPGSQKTHFYALGNDGRAAGHYEDSEGLFHGVILENGELRQYDFPDAVETQILGISDATGVLTGNFIDASGIRRGFTGETIIEFPGAPETYADFVNASGAVVGSYVDVDGTYHAYVYNPNGTFTSVKIPGAEFLEYFFIHGINDTWTYIVRNKVLGRPARTFVGTLLQGLEDFQFSVDKDLSLEDAIATLRVLYFPGSVSTHGWNINQDSSVVGYYDTADGHRHGFIARPAAGTGEAVDTEPVVATGDSNYIFESIDVPGVDFLALTASSDFEDYAGYTRSPDSEKEIAFTLIDDVFETYDFPGSQKIHFYALGNNGNAAGHYQDSDGLFHGVVLENGELRQYDFPGAVQTEIYGISDATGALTGNFIDASGVRRGFSGDEIIEVSGASETYADFVNATGGMVGSYVDAGGVYYPYVRTPDGEFVSFDLPSAEGLEYFFVHGINDAGATVARAKAVGDVPRTYAPTIREELKFPGSVSTEGWNINQDGSVVGHYDSPDGRRHGFIARPARDADAQRVATDYIFESINVPGVDFLQLTASSDFEDYAGNTRSADGEKMVGFTLIDGVFTTYDFPGSQNTYFYALGNNRDAAGHYEDSDGLHHGVVLDNGELRQYDFPGAVETQIFGISDVTGALTGNFIDASGVRRGFSGETIIDPREATETYADFVNARGIIVGSYVDADGLYHAYVGTPEHTITTVDFLDPSTLEYFFLHGITDAWTIVARAKAVGDNVQRTYVGALRHGLQELKFPGAVSTEGWNINQDGSVVGHYDSPDGRRHGFIARPAAKTESDQFGNAYTVKLTKGLNMLSVPLASPKPMTAKSLAGIAGATVVIALDAEKQRFIGWTPGAPNDGFPIEGGKGYIVSVPQARNFAFVGSRWINQKEAVAAPSPITALTRGVAHEAWAFVVSGYLDGKSAFDGYRVIVRNLRTNSTITASVEGDYFAAATADLSRRSVVEVGDVIELHVVGPDGNVESHTVRFSVSPEHLANAVLSVRLDGIGKPEQDRLLQNYPNPFNPETWIPYRLAKNAMVTLSIYNTQGALIRRLELGHRLAGFYTQRGKAAYWDGRNHNGEAVASGIYFYQLTTADPDTNSVSFRQLRRMTVVK